jgi:hypothetical protein
MNCGRVSIDRTCAAATNHLALALLECRKWQGDRSGQEELAKLAKLGSCRQSTVNRCTLRRRTRCIDSSPERLGRAPSSLI